MIDMAKKEFNKNLCNRRVLSYFNIINLILKLIKIRVFIHFNILIINEQCENIKSTVSSVKIYAPSALNSSQVNA
jgi:hypothetical protein